MEIETLMLHPAQKPELLAPAGDWEAMRAAVMNGADAVYFGLSAFNARHRATNFSTDELPKIISFLHHHNVQGFVTLNTLIFSSELQDVVEYVQKIATAGVDAVIVQDLGLARLIRKLAPTLPIHASTQMTLTEPSGIRFVQQHLGIDRVVLARELSLNDIRKVRQATDTPLEVFVHGALCVAYSGQCLTSEALGGRSANRGQCAQACRLPYEMLVDGTPKDLGDRAYLLSPQDLSAQDLIQELTDLGVVSFKIEGRLKTAHYVAATTQTYRAAIDAAIQNQQITWTPQQRRDLAQTFSRGFTPGFLEGVDHQQLVQGRFPKSRGVQIGQVVSSHKRGVLVQLISQDLDLVKAGDGVVFDLGKPEQQEPGGRIWEVQRRDSISEKPVVELLFETDSVDFSAIPHKTIVWKTDDPALRKRLEQSFASDHIYHRLSVDVTISGSIGSALTITVHDPEGNSASASWAGPLVAAKKHPFTIESCQEQLDRLGDTPFQLGELHFEVTDNVMVPKSILNDLRRQVMQKLQAQRDTRSQHPVVPLEAIHPVLPLTPASNTSVPSLSVLVRNLEQLDAVLKWRPAFVYCDFEDTTRYREAITRAKEAAIPIGLSTLRIIKPGEEGFLKPIASLEPDAILVRNLTAISYYQEVAAHIPLVGDFSLNVANEWTAQFLMERGLRALVPSYDLNWDQLAAMVRHSNPSWYEPVIHQHMPMFHMEHCVFAAFLSKGKDHRDCGRPCDHHKVDLRDRVGAIFPVSPDTGCRNTVYNSVAQSAAEYLSRMLELGLRRFRIDLLRETQEQIAPLLDRYNAVLNGQDDGRQIWRQLQILNQLGVTRGTLQLT